MDSRTNDLIRLYQDLDLKDLELIRSIVEDLIEKKKYKATPAAISETQKKKGAVAGDEFDLDPQIIAPFFSNDNADEWEAYPEIRAQRRYELFTNLAFEIRELGPKIFGEGEYSLHKDYQNQFIEITDPEFPLNTLNEFNENTELLREWLKQKKTELIKWGSADLIFTRPWALISNNLPKLGLEKDICSELQLTKKDFDNIINRVRNRLLDYKIQSLDILLASNKKRYDITVALYRAISNNLNANDCLFFKKVYDFYQKPNIEIKDREQYENWGGIYQTIHVVSLLYSELCTHGFSVAFSMMKKCFYGETKDSSPAYNNESLRERLSCSRVQKKFIGNSYYHPIGKEKRTMLTKGLSYFLINKPQVEKTYNYISRHLNSYINKNSRKAKYADWPVGKMIKRTIYLHNSIFPTYNKKRIVSYFNPVKGRNSLLNVRKHEETTTGPYIRSRDEAKNNGYRIIIPGGERRDYGLHEKHDRTLRRLLNIPIKKVEKYLKESKKSLR